MIFLKISGLVLTKEKIRESDALIYILTKNNGIIKALSRGLFKGNSKNLTLLEPGNFNRFFILTNLRKFKIISALPLKTPERLFKKNPYLVLWTLNLIKNLNLPETPKFIWFILTHLENYLKQNSKNFSFWFLYHLLKELGYEIDIDKCSSCQQRLSNFAFFDNKKNLFCFYCKKENYQKINKKELNEARKIKNLIQIPQTVPYFLRKIILNSFLSI